MHVQARQVHCNPVGKTLSQMETPKRQTTIHSVCAIRLTKLLSSSCRGFRGLSEVWASSKRQEEKKSGHLKIGAPRTEVQEQSALTYCLFGNTKGNDTKPKVIKNNKKVSTPRRATIRQFLFTVQKDKINAIAGGKKKTKMVPRKATREHQGCMPNATSSQSLKGVPDTRTPGEETL